MNILIITQKVDMEDSILGFMHRWIEEFSKHSKQVYVLCLYKGKSDLSQNVTVSSLGKESGSSRLKYIWNFYRTVTPLIVFRKVDKIFVHMNEIYVILLIPLLLCIRLRKIQLMWWKAHGHLGRMSRIARFFVDTIVTSSERGFPIDTPKRVVVGQGIDVSQFSFRKGQNLQKGISVGRMSPVKHYEDCVEIAALLKNKGVTYPIEIIGYNPGEKNEYFDMVREKVQANGVEKEVSFIPARPFPDMVRMYQEAETIINTSDTDSLDKVVLEAMACGCIPISSNDSYRPILEPYGLWVPKRDYAGFVRILERIISMDPTSKHRLQQDMRDEVRKNHSLTNLIQTISTL